MPTLQTGNSSSVLTASAIGATSGWYFAGLNFTAASGVKGLYPVIWMGDSATTNAQLPHNITFDRCLIHGNDQMVIRGFDVSAVNFTLENSQCYDFLANFQDTQCFLTYNGGGPYLIQNNFLEATGENVMSGGATGAMPYPASVPADITISGNHFHKKRTWIGQPAPCGTTGQPTCYDVKDHWECKQCQRVLIDGNIFDTTFTEAQHEALIINCFAAGNYTCQDVTITNNLIVHVPNAYVIAGNGNSTTGARILVRNNLGYDITYNFGGPTSYGWAGQVSYTNSLTVDHNTWVNLPLYVIGSFYGDPAPSTDANYTLSNNIQFGPLGANSMSAGGVVAALLAAGANILYNLNVGDTWTASQTPAYPTADHFYQAYTTVVPPGQTVACSQGQSYNIPACWPLDWALVCMVDFTGATAGTNLAGFALAGTSPYAKAGSDGADVGANVPAVLSAINGVR
jgi:hypothetical protein